MKLTKFEERIRHLEPVLTNKQKNSILSSFHITGFIQRNRAFCDVCGSKSKFTDPQKIVCPNCGTITHILEYSRYRNYEYYFMVYSYIDDIQILSIYELNQRVEKRKPHELSIRLISSLYLSTGGKFALKTVGHSSWTGRFSNKDLKLVNFQPRFRHRYIRIFNTYMPSKGNYIHPFFKKRGLTKEITSGRYNILYALRQNNSKVETLIKNDFYRDFIIKSDLSYITKCEKYFDQIKLAIRHQYYPANIPVFFDYIENLKQLGRDIYSPKYLFPNNLALEHARLVNVIAYKRRKKEQARVLKELQENEIAYKARVAKLLNFSYTHTEAKTVYTFEFINTITELQTLSKHVYFNCAFENEYYKEDYLFTIKKNNFYYGMSLISENYPNVLHLLGIHNKELPDTDLIETIFLKKVRKELLKKLKTTKVVEDEILI